MHEEQDAEGDHQHRRADRGGGRIGEFLELDDDEERRDLRDEWQIAGDEDHRAVFADGAGKREREAGEDRRRQRRQSSL